MEVFPFVDTALDPRGLGYREIALREQGFDALCPPDTYPDEEPLEDAPEAPPTRPSTHLMLYPRATRRWLYGPFDDVCEAWLRWLVSQGANEPGLPAIWEVQAHAKWGTPQQRAGVECNMLVADLVRWQVSFGAYTYEGTLRDMQELQVAVGESK